MPEHRPRHAQSLLIWLASLALVAGGLWLYLTGPGLQTPRAFAGLALAICGGFAVLITLARTQTTAERIEAWVEHPRWSRLIRRGHPWIGGTMLFLGGFNLGQAMFNGSTLLVLSGSMCGLCGLAVLRLWQTACRDREAA